MNEGTYSAKEREVRAAILDRDDHQCRYCGATAHQIDWVPGDETAVAVCRTCLHWTKQIPHKWTFDQRAHFIHTMQIANPIDPPHMPTILKKKNPRP